MSLSAKTLVPQELREKLAEDADLGGGNVLQKATAYNPHPDIPFVRLARPLINTAGRQQTEFSLLQLDHLAQSWSAWYYEHGIRPRDRVAIYVDDTFAYSLHFFALACIGAIPVLINSNAQQSVAVSLCRQTSPVGLYTDRVHLERLGDDIRGLRSLRWTKLVEELPAPPSNSLHSADFYRHAPEDPVSIMHSSGTTGRPKAVIQTHESSIAGPRYRLMHFKERSGSLFMTAQPQSHLGCIAYTTYAVLGGTPMVGLYDPSGSELAASVFQHQPTMVMAFGHAYAELAALVLPPGTLDSVDGWISMGDAVHAAHIKKILVKRSKRLPPAAFYDRFGTTELGWGLIVQPRTLLSNRSDRRVGKPDPVAEVAVLRKDGTMADVNEVGLFGAKGPTITAGYWNDSDTSYRSRLGGYWLTGDLVYRDRERNYFHVDRAADVIETSAGMGYSVLMEEVILGGISEIIDCIVVAGKRQDRIVPVALVKSTNDYADPKKLIKKANEVLRSAGHPELALLELAASEEDFPLGVTGKALKRQLRGKYSDLTAYMARQNDNTVVTVLGDDAEVLQGTPRTKVAESKQ